MTTFVALYRGQSVSDAKIIAVSADPTLVADVSAKLIERETTTSADLIVGKLERGRKLALRQIHKEAKQQKAAKAAYTHNAMSQHR